jgi:hypothetical protein
VQRNNVKRAKVREKFGFDVYRDPWFKSKKKRSKFIESCPVVRVQQGKPIPF